MIGIPWTNLKDAIATLGFIPLLGWPKGIDPMACMFTFDGKAATAIYKKVIVAGWQLRKPEWVDLR